MPPSKRPSLNETAYVKIRDLITTLQLTPGSPVDENKLMKKLSIGRTPVREALFRLATNGLLLNGHKHLKL